MKKSANNFSVQKRIKSFAYAFNGLRILFKEEHNSRIQILLVFLVIIAGILLKIEQGEWLAILLCFGFVLTTETINTAIENICNVITKEKHPQIKKIKDLSAAAVLLSVIFSLAVGTLIFVSKL